MTRILVVSQHFRRGGLETQVRGFCKFFSSRGDELHIATGREADLDPIAPFLSGSCRIDRWGLEGESILAASSTLKSYIADHDIEWLHLHPFESFFAGGLAAAQLQIPYCVTLHSPESLTWFPGISYRGFLTACLLPDASRVFVVSRETGNLARSMAPGIRLVTLPNGVDFEQYQKAEREPRGPWAIVGRLDSDKVPGIQEALSLFAEARSKGLLERVIVFGDGTARPALENWAKKTLRGEPWLMFRDHRESWSEEVQKERWAGIAGMGRVVLEGVAMNLPVFLIGYDGVKGLITAENIDRLAACNFSGRRERNLDYSSFERGLLNLNNGANFQLEDWAHQNADMAKIWAIYHKEMLTGLIKRESPPEWGDVFETCCRNLAGESIYSPRGVAEILEYLGPSTGRPFNAGQGLLVELLRAVEEKKNLNAELAMSRQNLDHERALHIAQTSSVEKDLTILAQERNAALAKIRELEAESINEGRRFQEQVQELTDRLHLLGLERDRAIQSEAIAHQALTEERAASGDRIVSLEQELNGLRQEREVASREKQLREQAFLTERQNSQEELNELEALLRRTERENDIIRQSHMMRQQEWAVELVRRGEEILRLEKLIALAQNQVSTQENAARDLERERGVLEEQMVAIKSDRAAWWKTYERDKKRWQQENAQLREELSLLKENRGGFPHPMAPQRQGWRDSEDLFELNLSLQEQFLDREREKDLAGSQFAKLTGALESLRQTSPWRWMCFLRRVREQVLLGGFKNRLAFCEWICRRIGGRTEPGGNPTFDPIGALRFNSITALQKAIRNAQTIRSWHFMCLLYTSQRYLSRRDLKGIWGFIKLIYGNVVKKATLDPGIYDDPIPRDLMQPPLQGGMNALPVSEIRDLQKQTFIFALDRGWGDVLMSLPVAEVLKKKYLSSRVIYILENEDYSSLVENNPYIDEVCFSRERMRLSPGAAVFDIRETPSDWHQDRLHITDMVASRFGVQVRSRRPPLYVPDDLISLDEFGLPASYVVAHVQSTTREKDWALRNWGPVLQHLHDHYGLATVLVGGANQQPVSLDEPSFIHDLRGRTSLKQTINIMKRACLFVGIDSGPMHIAGALNIPSVILWGNTSPIICGIDSDVVYNIEPERQCEKGSYWPCHFQPCPEKELCIDRISVDRVIQCVDGCLGRNSGVLVIQIGLDVSHGDKLSETPYSTIREGVFSPNVLNERIVTSPSDYFVLLSPGTPVPQFELERMVALARDRRWGIVSTMSFRSMGAGRYGEYGDNAVTRAHRGAPDFIIFRKDVFTRLGGFDPRAESVACCLNDFYFRALLMDEAIWSMKISGLIPHPQNQICGGESYLHAKWGEIDWARLQHLESVSFLDYASRDETLYLIFSHCRFNFGGGGQRWESLTKVAWKNSYQMLYIDELMPDEEAEAVVHEFLDTSAPRKIVIWARPVPRYRKHFDFFEQNGIVQVYDCIDDWHDMTMNDPDVPIFEEELIKNAKLVTVTAETLRKKIAGFRSCEDIPLIPNGADPDLFDFRRDFKRPPDLKKGALTLGYFGSLAGWWIDDELLCHLAGKLGKRAAINLIGVCRKEYADRFSKYPNIFLLGEKAHDQLPHYLSHFDVALVPFKVIPVTEATSPVKVYEYLFGGKPVVSTDLPEVRGLPYVFCVKTEEEFFQKVDEVSQKMLDPVGLDRFRALNSWDSRFRECLVQIRVSQPLVEPTDIVVVSYNTRALTENCILSIERHTKEYQLFVVDNHSTDGSVEMLEEMAKQGRLRLIKNLKNEGYGKAVNSAFETGSSKFLAILNSDIEVLSAWLNPLLNTLNSNDKTAAVGPKLISPSGGIDCAGVWGRNANPLIRSAEFNHSGVFGRVLKNVYISGACLVTRRATFRDMGRFDERFFFYFEDMDFCFKARYQGYEVLYDPSSVVVHHRSKASHMRRESTETWYSHSRHLFQEKWHHKLLDEMEFPLE
jgi:GT2 family glycosyltransferase/ADP-heptose:LPS heptosyltransferase/glycosyltransferase involved in cell wall biosynthesis